MAEAQRERNAAIDWIRTVSIAYIVGFWHMLNYSSVWKPTRPFYDVTIVALALFTLISGYLLGGARVTLRWGSLRAFWWKRLIRIYPPYLLALLVFQAFHMLGAPPLEAALLISMVLPPAPNTLWFMNMMVLFYLIAPLMIVALHRPRLLVGATAAAWLLLYAYWFFAGSIDQRLLVYLPVFMLGVLLSRHPVPPRPWIVLLSVAAFAGACAIAMNASNSTGRADESIWMAPVAWVGAFLIFICVNHRLPQNVWIERIGFGSFFLYLFHRPIYQALLKLSHMPDTWIRIVFLVCFCFPLAILFGIAAQRVYDYIVGWMGALWSVRPS